MSDLVRINLKDGIFTITLDHPPANALTLEMVRLLQAAFRQASQEKLARLVVLRGMGDNFSGGQDIYEILKAEGVSYRKHMQETYNPLVLQIRRLELPVLAEIRGTVAGAALGLALACDLRLASDEARFVVGFLGIGLAPDSAVSLFLPALIGLGRATEVAFTNEPILAQQALDWGLVNRLFPAHLLESGTAQVAKALASGPIHAMGLAKRDFNKAIYPHLEQVLDYEAHIQEIARLGGEHKEGVKAFVDKRPPEWMGG
ncbi:MAG: 2-(1,2-epoxy-1,2-dihydrophenyl)acetyl-CoA isomerase [Anaerolineales bacterium]|nr:2-(1,2-epoxy-1,2-dihydrophenyl)acetyl-CoA isomerase [Anaerolineae bacterium]PWB56423.1 MAG: 2-(1,2-epoxy-1,2-dihydrophenyl)acetyl-CoA isomerase [Anaerolineales bacterium]